MLQRIKYFVRAENAEETLVFVRDAVEVFIAALPKPDAAGKHDMRAIERISSFSWLLEDLQKYVTSELDFTTEAKNTQAASDALQ